MHVKELMNWQCRVFLLETQLTLWCKWTIKNPKCFLYKGMHIIITQNRDKKNGIINCQTTEVVNYEQGTIFLKLPNSNVVALHLVTEITEEGARRVFYPLVPAYGTTICKIQGQTLHWLDAYMSQGALLKYHCPD